MKPRVVYLQIADPNAERGESQLIPHVSNGHVCFGLGAAVRRNWHKCLLKAEDVNILVYFSSQLQL